MHSGGQILVDNLPKLGVEEIPFGQSVEEGGEPVDGCAGDDASWAHNPSSFTPRRKAVRRVPQVVERAHQEHCIKARRCGGK